MKSVGINNNVICTVSDNKELHRIREFIASKAKEFGFSDDIAFKISLAVDEACSNLIRHAFRYDSTNEICIEIEYNNKKFTINILDKGNSFNPLEVPQRNMVEHIKNHNRGGLGVHIIRSVMDEIKYFPSDDKNKANTLSLSKMLS